MKKIYPLATIVAFSMFMTVSAAKIYAEDDAPGFHKKWEEKSGERETKRLEMMTKKLKLTSDQQSSVKSILDEQHKQMETMGKEFADKRKALHEDTDKKIKVLLNDQQKADYAKMGEEMHKKMKERMEKHEHEHEHGPDGDENGK